jgi:hypothetical protein
VMWGGWYDRQQPTLQYMDEGGLRDFLAARVLEGFTFPLNPKWCGGCAPSTHPPAAAPHRIADVRVLVRAFCVGYCKFQRPPFLAVLQGARRPRVVPHL